MKTTAKWLVRDTTDPQHVGAATLPYDATRSIKDAIELTYSGARNIGSAEPADSTLAALDCVVWYDTATKTLRQKYKDADGTIHRSAEPHVALVSASCQAQGGDMLIVDTAGVTVTLMPGVNAEVSVRNTSAGTVTVVSASGYVDGGASFALNAQLSKRFACDGSNWWAF